jgi:DNA polymerase-4
MRKIIHIDMDAFYAAIEQRDNPNLKGKPVIVGGDPSERGVVATCSYEARKFGVHSAMSTSRAYHLCPQGIFIRPRFEVYNSVSQEIRKIFYEYTDLVEPLSLDEAYLDVTVNKKGESLATKLAKEIKQQIVQCTGLTASAGVSFNKFLAKVASDWRKPDGLTVIPPERAVEFIEQLPIRKFYGIGEVTEKKMITRGILTGADLRKWERAALIEDFGKSGDFFYRLAHCLDERPVNPHRIRKSYGKEITLQKDLNEREELLQIIRMLAEKVEKGLQKNQILGRTVTLKVRYRDFKTVTRSLTMDNPMQDKEIIYKVAASLLENTEAGEKYVRLLGISISHLQSV